MLTNTVLNLNYIIKTFLNYNTENFIFENSPEINFYIKVSITSYNICAFLLLFIFTINIIVSLFFKQYKLRIIKYINIIICVILLSVVLFKMYITFKVESIFGMYLYDIQVNFFQANKLGYLEHFSILSSSFSDAILILSIVVGLVCLDLLGSKDLFKSINNVSIFFLFTLFVLIMVSTNNLLIMFISFEFIFLPTVYFAYSLGYSKKIDMAAKILFYWTLFGSFLILVTLAYLYYQYATLNYIYLNQKIFSQTEILFLFSNFLIGFAIKVPVAPLHYWLLKVHVESPTAFSIYLSGFLVKSALYCLYMFLSLISVVNVYFSITIWILYSLMVSTIGLARQVDIKKLIAWATIQEMSFMLIFLLLKQLFLIHTCIIFVLLHGLMSSYMFYIVDILQRRFKTRSLQRLSGLNLIFPEITKYIWFLILLFSGFPLTVKFFIEWNIIVLLVESNRIVLIIVLFFLNYLSVIFFCKILFGVLYGSPTINLKDLDLCEIQKKEKIILNSLLYFILMLLLLVFIINWLKKESLLIIVYGD